MTKRCLEYFPELTTVVTNETLDIDQLIRISFTLGHVGSVYYVVGMRMHSGCH